MPCVNLDEIAVTLEQATLSPQLATVTIPMETEELSSARVFEVFVQMYGKTDCVTIGQRLKDMDPSCPPNTAPKGVYTKALRLYKKVKRAKKNKPATPAFFKTLPWRWESSACDLKVQLQR
jgi:hypothetical protein